jgi:hypothetical protein
LSGAVAPLASLKKEIDMFNSEERFDRAQERAMDSLDARLMAGKLSQADYDAEVTKLNQEFTEFYSRLNARRW